LISDGLNILVEEKEEEEEEEDEKWRLKVS
jgi:hypothetical protein